MVTEYTSSRDYRTISITVTNSYASLRAILNVALGALTLPTGEIILAIITPSSAINYKDAFLQSEQTMADDIPKSFICRNILDQLHLKAAGDTVCQLELYIDKG